MEAKVTVFFICLVEIAAFMTGCSNERAFVNVKQVAIGEERSLTGVFDLKSICLNAGPKNVVSEPFCVGYLSENSEPNADSIAVHIRICTEQDRTNCIDRLPGDAPPDSITIRNNGGQIIRRWGRNRVVLRKLRGSKPTFEVLKIY